MLPTSPSSQSWCPLISATLMLPHLPAHLSFAGTSIEFLWISRSDLCSIVKPCHVLFLIVACSLVHLFSTFPLFPLDTEHNTMDIDTPDFSPWRRCHDLNLYTRCMLMSTFYSYSKNTFGSAYLHNESTNFLEPSYQLLCNTAGSTTIESIARTPGKFNPHIFGRGMSGIDLDTLHGFT